MRSAQVGARIGNNHILIQYLNQRSIMQPFQSQTSQQHFPSILCRMYNEGYFFVLCDLCCRKYVTFFQCTYQIISFIYADYSLYSDFVRNLAIIGFCQICEFINNLQYYTDMDNSNSKRQLGINRSRYPDYLKIKGKQVVSKSRKRFSKNSLRKTIDEDELVQSTLLNYSTKTSEIELSQISEPSWMPDYRKCNFLISEIDEILETVREEKIKKMTAINEDKHNRVIEKLYSQASVKVQHCEKNLKNIQRGCQVVESPQEQKILANTLMSLAMRIREKAKQIRQAQQQDLSERKNLTKFSSINLECQDLMNKDPEDADWLSEQGFQALEQQLSSQRNQQILKLVSSIHSLNTIYKQLQDIVIQQGSLLDRIDENITTAATNIESANEHLTKAEEHQKSPTANRIIVVLVLMIVACVLVLAFR